MSVPNIFFMGHSYPFSQTAVAALHTVRGDRYFISRPLARASYTHTRTNCSSLTRRGGRRRRPCKYFISIADNDVLFFRGIRLGFINIFFYIFILRFRFNVRFFFFKRGLKFVTTAIFIIIIIPIALRTRVSYSVQRSLSQSRVVQPMCDRR